MLSTAIAESLNRSYSGSLIQTLPGESTENLYRLENSSAEFALTHSSSAYGAVNGIGSFEKQFTNLSGICVFYPSAAQLVVKKKAGATSFSDFIENKIPLRISIGVRPKCCQYSIFIYFDRVRIDSQRSGGLGLQDLLKEYVR